MENTTLELKIEIVKNEILKRFPDQHYTIKILLWDDGTDLVECRHGDGEKIYTATYYDNKLEYMEDIMLSNRITVKESGQEFYVLTESEYNHQMKIG